MSGGRWIVPVLAVLVGQSATAVAAPPPSIVPPSGSATCVPLLRCPSPVPLPSPATGESTLRIGITEGDPELIADTDDDARADAQSDLKQLEPHYVRVLIDWAKAQPRKGREPRWGERLTDQLRAIARRQRAGSGWEAVLVPYFTPTWAAARPRGCERPKTTARARMPRIAHYRAMVRSLQRLLNSTGVRDVHMSPWNEPNHPGFLNPQRATCDVASPPLAPALYSKLVHAMRRELEPGQDLIVGDAVGLHEPRTHGASTAEFIAALPAHAACAGTAWAQHSYVGVPGTRRRDGSRMAPPAAEAESAANLGLVDDIDAALRAHGCPQPIWMTETGTFDHRCEAMATALSDWARDGRVTAAFQYTFREAESYPVGLYDPALKRRYASYDAWRHVAAHGADDPAAGCSD